MICRGDRLAVFQCRVKTLKVACPLCGAKLDVSKECRGKEVTCPACEQAILIPERVTKKKNRSTPQKTSGLNKGQELGLMGSIVLMIGVFAPLANIPIVGSVNYYMNGQGDGVFILGLAIVSLMFAAFDWRKLLWLTGGASVALTGIALVRASEIFSGKFVTISWGWVVLLAGSGILFLSACWSQSEQ